MRDSLHFQQLILHGKSILSISLFHANRYISYNDFSTTVNYCLTLVLETDQDYSNLLLVFYYKHHEELLHCFFLIILIPMTQNKSIASFICIYYMWFILKSEINSLLL